MNLRPQDLVVCLKLAVSIHPEKSAYSHLAAALDLSPSEVHSAVRRATEASLLTGKHVANRAALREFIIHGVKYVWVPRKGRLTRGLPTAHAVPPLKDLMADTQEPPPVWPHPDGTTRGESFEPLYRSAPEAALRDPRLYELLALVDAIRGGRARERALAEAEVHRLLGDVAQ